MKLLRIASPSFVGLAMMRNVIKIRDGGKGGFGSQSLAMTRNVLCIIDDR
jgi:hypothetical protein